jgi:transglutaminase-like putative cysteine protease
VSVDQQLHADRRLPVFTYQTDASQPPYFQIYVLDQLGATWTLVPPTATVPITPSGGLPGVPGLLSTSGYAAVHETVHLVNNLDTSATSAGGATYLPLAYPPRSVRPPTGEWTVSRSTLMVLAQDADIAGMRYQVSGLDVSPTAARLAADPATVYRADLYVPSGLHGLMGLAEQITKGKTTEFGKAVALQQYFTESGQFTYTLNVAPPGTNASIIQFLEKTRRGFCEHFAFSMAILSRLLGIPARVAIGYTAGTQISQGTWQVTTSDAHAWPELYFQGYGWLRFEPTPSASTAEEGQPTALPPPYTATGGGSASPPGGSRPPAGNGTGRPPGRAHGGGGSLSKLTHSHGFGGAVGTTAAHQGPGVPVGLISLAVLALLAVLPTSARVTARHWRWWRAHDDQTRAGAAWRELMDDLTDHKVANRRSDSPRMLARRASQLPGLSEAGKQALERVCLAAERASYAISPADSSSLRQDVATARRALARASSLRVRLRALVLPTSALAPAKAGLQHVLDVFGWIDLASTAVWHRGTRHPHATRSRGPAPVPTGALGRSL